MRYFGFSFLFISGLALGRGLEKVYSGTPNYEHHFMSLLIGLLLSAICLFARPTNTPEK